MMWWQSNEKAGATLLKITFLLVSFTPKILLKPIVFCVCFIYFCICKSERENIKRYLFRVKKHLNVKVKSPFYNFYNFSLSICDKMAVYIGKIKFQDLNVKNLEFLESELMNKKQGQIIITSHFGNVEVARAISRDVENFCIVILMYSKHSTEFFKLINELSKNRLEILLVENLDITTMIKLSEMIKCGKHIGIMADRTPIHDKKKLGIKFLGDLCEFPLGAFILASVLKTGIGSLWCIKKDKGYEISYEKISDSVNRKDDELKKCLEIYTKQLENKIAQNPEQWYNFYDFWRDNEKNKF